jgi:hypothetical protein
MARISLNPPRTPLFRVVEWYCRRRYGAMVDPGKALGHNARVLYAELRFEQAVAATAAPPAPLAASAPLSGPAAARHKAGSGNETGATAATTSP